MLVVPFDVNDAVLRRTFLRESLPAALRALEDTTAAEWGKMNAQQMVEHLRWVFELSTGREHTESPVPSEKQEYLRQWLYTNEAARRDFMNPVLMRGLPPLEQPTLSGAKADLLSESERFLSAPGAGGERFVHPLFGPLDHEQWERAHYKHCHHHLVQFGLIDSAARPPAGGAQTAEHL